MNLIRTLGSVVVVGGALLAGGASLPRARTRESWPPAPKAAIVAVVDGARITSDDLDVRLADLLPAASYHGHVEADRLLSLKRAALDELVLDELIHREAIKQGMEAAPSAVEAEWNAVLARFERPADFRAALAENGLTDGQFRARLARSVVVREARRARDGQPISAQDVEAYYREHHSSFRHPERVHLLQILLRADPADAASWPRAERRARAVLQRLQQGQDFGALARVTSEDEYRVKDGDMGVVHRGRLDEAFEAAVFSAPVGRLAVARSIYGVEVFKVQERLPESDLSIDEARPIIVKRLRDQAVHVWHTRLLAAARVEIRDAVLRAAHPAPLAPLQATSARATTANSAGGLQ
jgi:parvulin-like peptidyl-prolyl isomerase